MREKLTEHYDALLTPQTQRRRCYKKLVISQKIPLRTDGFNIQATLWIPNTPYTEYEPRIVLTLNTSKKYRGVLQVDHIDQLDACLTQLLAFIRHHRSVCQQKLEEAKKDQRAYRAMFQETIRDTIPEPVFIEPVSCNTTRDSNATRDGNRVKNEYNRKKQDYPGGQDRATQECDLSGLPALRGSPVIISDKFIALTSSGLSKREKS